MARETPIDYYRLSPDDIVRQPNKLYVIAAEGDRTEFKYFEAVRDKYSAKFNKLNWHLEILRRPSKQRGKSSPKDVEQMLNDFLEDNKDYDLKSYDELWLIIDTDTWEQETIKQLAEKCQFDTLYHLGLSNPCFELWLILHLADFNDDVRTFKVNNAPNAPLINKCIERFKNNNDSDLSIKKCIEETTSKKKRSKTCKQLVELIRSTLNISSIPEGLIDYIPQAILRAKKLGEQCNPNDDNYPQNICTSVYKLLETLT